MRRKSLCLMLCGVLALSLIGCGDEQLPQSDKSDIVLLEPVTLAGTYEEATYRTLYDTQIVSATVVPYIEEYAPARSLQFKGFGAYPGETVKKGDNIFFADSTNLEKQIEQLEKQMASDEEQHLEFQENCQKQLDEMQVSFDGYQYYVDYHKRNPGAATPEEIEQQVTLPYRAIKHSMDMTRTSMRQNTENYNLDRAHKQYQLNNLKKQRKDMFITSKIDGVIVGGKDYNPGDWVSDADPVIAVGDLNQKLLKSEYINSATAKKAEEIYAIIDGKRYEVAYQAISSEEYVKLNSQGEKITTTYQFVSDTADVNIGDFAVIVIINKRLNNVLSIPKSALKKDDLGQYVSILENGTNTVKYVKTGATDGAYVEVLSGIAAGDRVVVDSSMKTGGATTKLAKSSFNTSFENNGAIQFPYGYDQVNTIEYGTTYFVKTEMQPFQHVEKGDVIGEVRVAKDEIALERKESERARLAKELTELEEQLKDATEKDKEKRLKGPKEQLAELDKVIAKMKQDFATTTIKAEKSGAIQGWRMFEAEEIIDPNTFLFNIADESTCFLAVENTSQLLQLGTQVAISYTGLDRKEATATGTVVSMANIGLSRSLSSDNVLISIPKERAAEMSMASMMGGNWWGGPPKIFKIKAVCREMDNVIVVPKKAVTEIDGKPYVCVKQPDGKLVMQGFVAGGSNMENYWVVEGLTEGMEICLE